MTALCAGAVLLVPPHARITISRNPQPQSDHLCVHTVNGGFPNKSRPDMRSHGPCRADSLVRPSSSCSVPHTQQSSAVSAGSSKWSREGAATTTARCSRAHRTQTWGAARCRGSRVALPRCTVLDHPGPSPMPMRRRALQRPSAVKCVSAPPVAQPATPRGGDPKRYPHAACPRGLLVPRVQAALPALSACAVCLPALSVCLRCLSACAVIYSYHSCKLRSSSALPLLLGSAELSTPLETSAASSASANISATCMFVMRGTP